MFSTIKSLTNNAKSVLTVAAAAALLGLAALPGTVQAFSSPFTAMSGSWSGSGTITMSSGNKERIRCRAKYDVDGGGSNLDLTLRCASDSYNFELQSNVAHNNGAVSGTWSENTRHVGGNIDGSARGNAISRAGVGRDLGDARGEHQRQPAVDLDPGAGHRIAVGGDLAEPRHQVASVSVASSQSKPGRASNRAPGFVYSGLPLDRLGFPRQSPGARHADTTTSAGGFGRVAGGGRDAARAQADWPNRPVKVIVPYPPAGGADTTARILFQKLVARCGASQFVIDNRGGAGGTIGEAVAAKSDPDGYTILYDATAFSVNPALYPKLSFDYGKDFEPVFLASLVPNILVVTPSVEAKTRGRHHRACEEDAGRPRLRLVGQRHAAASVPGTAQVHGQGADQPHSLSRRRAGAERRGRRAR